MRRGADEVGPVGGTEDLHAGEAAYVFLRGRAVLVVQKHLGSDSLARWLDAQGFLTTRLQARVGYRLLEVQCAR